MNIDELTIRPMTADDLDAVAQARAVGFGSDRSRALAALQNNPRYDTSHIIVADYAGQIVGTATNFPVQMWLSGVPVSVGAVAGVAVLPEFRRQGVAAKLMEHAITQSHTEGYTLSALYPFSHKYYANFGYGTVSDLHAYRFDRHNLNISPQLKDKVRDFEATDLRMMRVMYKGQLTWHNGWFTRSDEWWDRLISGWPKIKVFDNDGLIEGYYAYNLSTDSSSRRVLNIKEFFAAESEAYQALLSYLSSQEEADIIEYLAPADSLLHHSLLEPRAVDPTNWGYIFDDLCHITPGPMARIVNLPQALTSRFYTRGMSGERVLKVSDPLIPANEAPIVFRLVDGRAETRPAEGNQPQIETDIATLSQILCGYMKAVDANRLGRFKATEETCSWLDKIIVDTPLYIQAGDWF